MLSLTKDYLCNIVTKCFCFDELYNFLFHIKKASRAANNWALLTVGLLNREYQRIEKIIASQQRAYLARRHDFLEEQIIHHRHLRSKEPGLKHPNPTEEVDKAFFKSRQV